MSKFFSSSPISVDGAALLMRVGAGLTMLTHGWPKLTGFMDRMNTFADPYGLGSPASLVLAIFAEVICSVCIIIGFYTRLALIPLIITMGTVILKVHWHDPFGRKELPILYLIVYIAILLTGSGKYSVNSKA